MRPPRKAVEIAESLDDTELQELCEATDMAIIDGGGFGWVDPPARDVLERYWRGVLLVPERELFVLRLNDTICGSAQLVRPPRNNEAQGHAATLQHFFLAPWARGHGLAREVVMAVERRARKLRFKVLNLDVRATQERAIQIYLSLGFTHWGTHPDYARVRGQTVPGYFFYKELTRTRKPNKE